MKSTEITPASSILQYDKEYDRWGYQSGKEAWLIDYLHCGDVFYLEIGEQKLKCRIEMDNDWYVISSNKRFKLHPKEQYEIIIP
ncbi:DUF5348 domain-containing protein [Gorillibacterium massiliense]|uniref:DUF5348 domain-containing protein n=1 Tax=Gorillibacterium massiliense TaxID=1280390 RepID=UPI00069363B8|nr:DUF5348 domain-containing protein [Gorillibacterium massiliense]